MRPHHPGDVVSLPESTVKLDVLVSGDVVVLYCLFEIRLRRQKGPRLEPVFIMFNASAM